MIEGYEAVMAKINSVADFQEWATKPMAETVAFGAKYFAKNPGPVKYPIQWASERQRRAFFATDGFGGGIPYSRSGAMQTSWRGSVEARNYEVRGIIDNTVPYAPYVQGKQQQPFHANTGWRKLAVVEELQRKLEEEFALAIWDLINK